LSYCPQKEWAAAEILLFFAAQHVQHLATDSRVAACLEVVARKVADPTSSQTRSWSAPEGALILLILIPLTLMLLLPHLPPLLAASAAAARAAAARAAAARAAADAAALVMLLLLLTAAAAAAARELINIKLLKQII